MRADDKREDRNLQTKLVRLNQAKSASEQATQAQLIFELVKARPEPAEMDLILPLLKHSNDVVVYWGAMTIGLYGANAKVALPKLQEIASRKHMYGSKTSQSGAAAAVRKIKTALIESGK
jgi:hypothetical protein